MSSSPIVLFTYDRPDHTRLTIEALSKNEGASESDVFIYSDGPKSPDREGPVQAVREYLQAVTGFASVTVIEREKNLGLAASVITGVTETLKDFPSTIVVEDDLLTARNFLTFVNTALDTYRHRQDVFSVTGYNYPIEIPATYRADAYLSYRFSSWGWGTWRDRWNQVDWSVTDYPEFVESPRAQELFRRGGDDLPPMLAAQMAGELDSWAIRFSYEHYKHEAFCLHPVVSKVQNIGFDGTGVHSTDGDGYVADLDPAEPPFHLSPDLMLDVSVQRAFDRRFRSSRQPRRIAMAKRRLRRLAPFVGG